MTFKKLLTAFSLLLLVVLFAGNVNAQTTVYVDNTPGVGNDFNSGATPASPKATIYGAQVAYPSGTVINIKGTGTLYNETVDLGSVAATNKEFTFTSNGGTPLIANLTVNLTTVAAPFQNQVTFTGSIQIQNTLTLTAGDVLGAGFITMGTSANNGAVVVVDGNVDARMNFSGRVAYTYNPTASRSTGNELPLDTNTSNMGNLTITPAFTITLDQNLTMNGIITVTAAGAILDLNGYTLTVQRGGTTTVNGDIVNGNLVFNMTTAAVIVNHAAGKILPDVTVNDAISGVGLGYAFTLNGGAGSLIGSLVVQGDAVATITTAYNFDTANGTGNLELQSTGFINVNAAQLIEGNVINSSTFSISAAGSPSRILFGNFAQDIRGQVKLTGSVTISGSTARTLNKTIEFATTAAATEIRGGISNECTVNASGNVGHAQSGSVLFTARTGGVLGVNASGRAMTLNNTSTVTNTWDGVALLNGAISTGPALATNVGAMNFNNISTSGGSGGVIIINGDGAVVARGTITNNRTDASGIITFDNTGVLQNYAITGGIVSSGSSTITFDPVGGTVTVGGTANMSGGTVTFPTGTNATTFSFGGITTTDGTLNLSGTGAITSAITVGGNVSFTGGTVNFGTAGRTMTVAGTDNYIGGNTTNPTITCAAAMIMQFVNPTLAQVQQITIGGALPVWTGCIDVANGTNLLLPVKFVGGNLIILGNLLSFTVTAPGNGSVEIDGSKLVVGRHLNAPTANGNFTNTAGYTSTNNGMVSMAGTGGQVVTGNGTAGYQFGDFESDHAGAATAPANAIDVTGNLYLTKGTYDNLTGGFNITFGNTSVTPTIIRAEGLLTANPVFISDYNIQYIGTDKVASFEMAGGDVGAATKRLNDVTVSTTNGANVAGKGTVELNFTVLAVAGVQLKGTLTIDAGQTLLLREPGAGPSQLRLNGASVVLNGDIANTAANALLRFMRTTGTTITGPGYLPDMEVGSGSSGNYIDGATASYTGLLGVDNLKGTDDVNVTTTAATGGLDLLNGTAVITVIFGDGSGLDGSHLNNFTTANGSNTLNLGANLILSGNMNHTKGTVNLDIFNLQSWGAAPSVTGGAGGATFTGTTGTLQFRGPATVLSLPTGDVTVNSNVQVNLANLANVFQLDNATAGNLIATKDFTLTRGTLQLGNAGTARNLTLRGANFKITANGSVNAVGIGRVILNPTTPPLTMAFAGAPTIARLTITNDVVLADIDPANPTATDLTVSTSFIHNGGNLDFSDFNLIFQTAFQRTAAAGTYSAADGYMVFDDNAVWTVAQGPAFSIPNLAIGTNTGGANDIDFATTAGNGMVTVTGALDIDIAGSTFNPNGMLTVADGAIVSYFGGSVGDPLIYTASAKMYARNRANGAIPTNVWPATLIPTDFRVNATGGVDVYLPGDRSVLTLLDLRVGRLDLSTNDTAGRTLTLTGSTVRRRHLASVRTTNTNFSGSLVYTNAPNVIYEPTVGGLVAATVYTAGVNFPTGPELPATVSTLTFTRVGNVANSVVTIITPVTVTGLLTIKNDVTTAPIVGGTPVGTITAQDGVTIGIDTGALPTVPVLIFNTALLFNGTLDQTITVVTGVALGSITINKATGSVLISGGNLQMRGGAVVNFVLGLLKTGSNAIILDAPSFAGGGGQGFTKGTGLSHVYGTVGKFIANTGAINTSTVPRSEFPVGSLTLYRPAALTFNNQFGVPTTPHTTVLVGHVNANPTGSIGLPIQNGVATGIDVSRYPVFYWNISTTPSSVSPSTAFDFELTSAGFTDFDDINNVRIIRRHGAVGDITNQWLLQGANNMYDNSVNSGVPTVINRNSTAGLRSGGAIFTLGIKSNMSVQNPIAKQWLVLSGGSKNYVLTNVFTGNIGALSFLAQSSNTAVATVTSIPASQVFPATLKITPVAIGDCNVTITAVDAANNDFFAYSFPVNVGLTDVENEVLPTEFALYQNFPNPFNPTTNIKFALPKEANVSLKIYNVLGQEVASLVNQVMPAGYHTVDFNATQLSSGMYIYRIEAGDFVQVKKMLLMK